MIRRVPGCNELTFLCNFVWGAGFRGRRGTLPNAYGSVEHGQIDSWPPESLEMIIDQGRKQLDLSHALLESSRRRGQYLAGMATVILGIGALRVANISENVLTFVTWSIGMLAGLAALLIAYAIVCARAELGSIDTVLLSQEDGSNPDGLKRTIAEAHILQVQTSVNTAAAWLTVLQDGIRLAVLSAVLVILSVTLANLAQP